MAIAVLAVSFLLRGVGDSGGSHGLSWLTWLSPIGWAELARPFAGDRWWVLAVPVAGAGLGIAAAFMLAGSRDQGAGLVQPRPGPPAAGLLLHGPAGLAWRLQRAALAGWAAGFLAGGLAIGVVAQGIGQLLGTSKAIEQALHQIGGQSALVSTYLSACMSLLGLVAAAYAVAAVLRLRAGEADGHRLGTRVEQAPTFAEPFLGTDSGANLGHVAGRARKLGGFQEMAIGSQGKPLWNAVGQRAT